jgi:hypothetical protein
MRRTVLAAAVLLICAGCDSGPSPTSNPRTGPATPTADVRLAAADAYLAALTTRGEQMEAVRSECGVAVTAPQLRSCWGKRAAAQRVFNTAFTSITFPDDVTADVAALVLVDTRLLAAMNGIATSSDPVADRSDDGIYSSASADFLAGTVTLRTELGIIPTATAAPSP